MNEEMLLEEMRAMREEMHAMREQMTSMIGDTNKKLEVIGGFVKAMNETQTFEKTMRAVENVTRDITGSGRADFIAVDGDRYFTTDGENREYYEPKDREMLGLVMEDGNIFVDGDIAVIPVQSNNNTPVGWIIAEKSGGFDGIDLSQLARGSTVMDTISLAIEKELNHSHAVTDELTQLKNRDGLHEYLKNTIVPASENTPVSILMCDMDHFKAINDNYGHQAGDMVLRQVAQILGENTRNGIDSAFRVGGEEMMCILGCDTERAAEIAERIRGQIEMKAFMYEGQEIPVTVSIGVHEMQDMDISEKNVLEVFDMGYEAADKALYEAKESGRNQVVVSEESKKREPSFFNKGAYRAMQNKTYINCDTKTAYDISQTAQNMGIQHSVKYDGSKSSVVLDGVKNKDFVNFVSDQYKSVDISAERPKQNTYQEHPHNRYAAQNQSYGSTQPGQKKAPTFFNKEGFGAISNKIYVNTDSRTAYNISKAAQMNGVEHSVKYDGEHSIVTLDGVKDRHFIDIINSMAEWAAKVQIKAAQMREQHSRPIGEGAR
ncbi:MAG: GGDEF domain-containing protein [Ruminococcus sp.]|nr:GGDEF domain-containing protein [Ruminococcus sp.]